MSPRVIEALERIREFPGVSAMVKPAASFPYGPAGVHVYVAPEDVSTWRGNGWSIGPGTVRGHVPDPGHVVMFRGMDTRVVADTIAAAFNQLRGFAPEPDATTEPLDGYLQAHGDAVQAFAAAHEALQRCHADAIAAGGLETVPAGSRARMARFAVSLQMAMSELGGLS